MSVINTNITSLIAQKNLSASQSALTTAMERLSSGMRINSAKDDAAGQAIANRMSSQITGLGQAQRNANDGISVAQTAEGALNQINDNLQRIRELSVQAANGTNSEEDKASIQAEINQRLGEINRISEQTDFNGTKVLSKDQTLTIQVGANDGEAISISLKQINAETLGLTGFNVDGSGEIANQAATADDLTLAGFTKATTENANGSYTYTKIETVQNTAASIADVLGKAATGDTVAYAGTNNGTGTAAAGSYTYDAASDSFSFDADDVSNANTASYLTQGMTTGQFKTATVDIGGTTQDIKFDSEGNIFAADDGAVLYLDSTGNLTKNSAGSPPAATLENLTESMTLGAGTATSDLTGSAVFSDGNGAGTNATTNYDFGALNEGESITVGGRTLTATGSMTAAQVQSAFVGQYGSGSDATVGTAGAAGSFTMTGTATAGFSVSTGAGTSITFDSGNDAVGQSALSASKTTLGAATGGSIIVGSTTLTADDAADGFDITGATISADRLSTELQATGGTINVAYGSDPDVAYTITAGGAVDVGGTAQYVQTDGSIGSDDESDTVTTYYAQADGKVTDSTGAQVYKEEDGDLTLSSTTAGTATEDPLAALDAALKQVDSLRSDLGAIQNRFDSAISNLSTTTTNLSAARSRIEDADYAVEVANMTKAQILQQAGTSVLAQANQIPQGVLSLLG
ncbi:flagellin [Azotobacter sp. CWF10]